MKRYIVLGFLLVTSSVFSQEIKIKHSFWGEQKFVQDGKEKSIGFNGEYLKQAVTLSPKAVGEVNKFAIYNTTANVCAGVGGFCIGWPIGSALMGGEVNKNMLIGGAALVAVGVTLNMVAQPFLDKAAEIYNSHFKESKPAEDEIKEETTEESTVIENIEIPEE